MKPSMPKGKKYPRSAVTGVSLVDLNGSNFAVYGEQKTSGCKILVSHIKTTHLYYLQQFEIAAIDPT